MPMTDGEAELFAKLKDEVTGIRTTIGLVGKALGWALGVTGTLILGLGGWTLTQIYEINADTKAHTTALASVDGRLSGLGDRLFRLEGTATRVDTVLREHVGVSALSVSQQAQVRQLGSISCTVKAVAGLPASTPLQLDSAAAVCFQRISDSLRLRASRR